MLLGGCSTKSGPKPSDTNFDPKERNWLEVYAYEIQVAKENQDMEAWRFFYLEFIKELRNQSSDSVIND